jgi:hypothetical protein
MSLILFLALQSATSAPIAAPPAPPMPPPVYTARTTMTPQYRRQPTEVAVFDVELRGGDVILWRGQLRASDVAPASFTQRESNAPEGACPRPFDYQGDANALSLNISSIRFGEEGGSFNVRASWDRPTKGGCVDGSGQRSLSVTERLAIAPGEAKVIRGDAGFEVRLRRR